MTSKDILEYISNCINHDYMMGILITSASEGILSSIGMDYGVGKSTLAMDIAFGFVKKFKNCTDFEAWEIVKTMLHRFPWELEEFIANAPIRYPGDPVFYIYEDMQETLGKDKSRDAYVRDLYNRTSTRRKRFAVFFGNAPDISKLALCWREFFTWEIKVPSRGRYEVQRIAKKTRFDRPYEVEARMPKEDCAVSDNYSFPILPKEIQTWYDNWKEDMNKRSDEGEAAWNLKGVRNVMTDSAKSLLKDLVDKGSYTRQTIVGDMDKAVDLKLLKSTGMIELFGDTVVPTRQARLMVKIL